MFYLETRRSQPRDKKISESSTKDTPVEEPEKPENPAEEAEVDLPEEEQPPVTGNHCYRLSTVESCQWIFKRK